MKKYLIPIIILVIVAVIAAAMVYVLLQPRQSDMLGNGNDTQQVSEETEPAEDGMATAPSTAVPGTYEDYNETAFAQAEGRRLLFFYAPWCPQCRALDASINEGTVPSGAAIFKIDYDSNQGLRQRYEVMIQTTLVEVDENGNEIQKYVAYDVPTLSAVGAAMNL